MGLAFVKPKLDAFPDNVRLLLLSASFYGLLGQRDSMLAEEKRALGTADFSAWELHQLASVHAKRGDLDRAIELLRRSFQQGFVYGGWEFFFKMAAVPIPESEAYREFVRDFEAETRRLMETY